ncbi:MAG: hypothetical protein ACRDAU_11710 [Clostridium sp.]
MTRVNGIRGLKLEKDAKKILLRNSEISNIDGSFEMDREIKEIICIDMDVSTIDIKVIEFADLNLVNLYGEISFDAFVETNTGHSKLVLLKRAFVISKKLYVKNIEFDLSIVDGLISYEDNKLSYSLVILMNRRDN